MSSIIPEGEPGKTVICQAGGRIEQLLRKARLVSGAACEQAPPRTSEARDMQAWEESVLAVARMDIDRAVSVAEQQDVTRAELSVALFFLAQSARSAVRVAEARGRCAAMDDVPEDSWRHGPCNLPASHGGTHVNDACHSWGDA
ncbi:hypothetical protein ABZ759_02235 [Streptomyces sp. NPDC047860]|uniref:hypothetical protein n=1 Tax=Streptomyces sp. NPDC047860 TaxID=3155743 RepID=UPI0033C863BA